MDSSRTNLIFQHAFNTMKVTEIFGGRIEKNSSILKHKSSQILLSRKEAQVCSMEASINFRAAYYET